MRLGVPDIGSDSAQLQVVDVRPGAPPLPAHCPKEPMLLGEEIEPDGSVSQAGIDRVVKAVASAVPAASRHGVDQLCPFATSAVRDAINREEIVGRIQVGVGLRPQFLPGEHEARLTYLAAHRWYGWSVATSKTVKQPARFAGAPPQREGPFVPGASPSRTSAGGFPGRRRCPRRNALGRAVCRSPGLGRSWLGVSLRTLP
ncbi:hypothetical protein [Lentzea sp.]|uniref:Ppx/GppA phosphatase family protein n=1 Tax=Lentzea sp. TaxID=56099 RepID=UPI002C1EE7D8|nr:hypothetical protein [Lentzea sp.]HUQ57017.1 hypothetical protein [Lentzea sp.]